MKSSIKMSGTAKLMLLYSWDMGPKNSTNIGKYIKIKFIYMKNCNSIIVKPLIKTSNPETVRNCSHLKEDEISHLWDSIQKWLQWG